MLTLDDAAHLKLLREMYGSRAETAIRAALAFDAYFAWYYAWKRRVPINADKADKEARALENMQLAVDLHEIYERVSLYNHGSYMPHGAIFKITESILEVGDVEAFDTGPLELLNAEAKRKAKSNGATNLETIGAGQAQRGPTKAGAQGPSRLCGVAERATTMALSVAYNLLITNTLRRGDGVASIRIPTERRAERLFGDGPGRSKLVRRGIKLEHLGEDYSPEKDSVIAAMVRIVVARVRPAGDPEA